MSAEVINESVFWFYCFLTGIGITLVYDLIRIARRVIPHIGFFVALEDGIFWVYACITIFLLLYRMNNGTLRWFAVFGLAAGMWIYKKVFGDFLVNFMSTFIQRTLHLVVHLISVPLKLVKRPIFKGLRLLGKCKTGVKNKLTRIKKQGKITLCKHNKQSETGKKYES